MTMPSETEVRSNRVEDAEDARLRTDIRLLGRILGDTVRDQEGADVFDLVERIRQTSIRFHRDDDKPARRELEAILDAMSTGDTVRIAQSLDYEAVIAQASGAVTDMVALTRDLHAITSGIVRGEGTLGQLVTNRTLYDQLNGTLGRANVMLASFQNPNGTIGRMLNDPALYNKLLGVIGSTDSLVVSLNSSKGTAGLLLRDSTLYRNLVGITTGADSLMKSLASGQGTVGKFLSDQTLYDQLNKLVTDLSAMLAEIRKDPSKYMKGIIKVF